MSLELALSALERGQVVAAPSESVFGLLADATRPEAVTRLFGLKPRGTEKGMPILLPDRAAWSHLVLEIPKAASKLADRFWPGPLTIALAAARSVDHRLLSEATIGVRWAGACPAAELAARFGRPLTATSANLPGAPPLNAAESVRREFAEAVRCGELFVLDGAAPGGAPSTVVLVEPSGIRVVREGAIAAARVFAELGNEH